MDFTHRQYCDDGCHRVVFVRFPDGCGFGGFVHAGASCCCGGYCRSGVVHGAGAIDELQGGRSCEEDDAAGSLRQAHAPRAGLCGKDPYKRSRADERRGSRAARGVFRVVSAAVVLCRCRSCDLVLLSCALELARGSRAVRLRASYPGIHHGHPAHCEACRASLLGQILRSGRDVFRESAGSYDAQDLPGRCGAP